MLDVLELKSPIRDTVSIVSPIIATTVEVKSEIIEELQIESLVYADVYSERVKK